MLCRRTNAGLHFCNIDHSRSSLLLYHDIILRPLSEDVTGSDGVLRAYMMVSVVCEACTKYAFDRIDSC